MPEHSAINNNYCRAPKSMRLNMRRIHKGFHSTAHTFALHAINQTFQLSILDPGHGLYYLFPWQ